MPLNNFHRNYMRNTVMKQEQFKMILKTVVIILGKERGWTEVRVAKEKRVKN